MGKLLPPPPPRFLGHLASLLRQGVDVNSARGVDGVTALHVAAASGMVQAARLLCEQVRIADPSTLCTPLSMSTLMSEERRRQQKGNGYVRIGRYPAASCLQAQGRCFDRWDNRLFVPDSADSYLLLSLPEMTALLLDAGADPGAWHESGLTFPSPLQSSCAPSFPHTPQTLQMASERRRCLFL